MDEPDKHSPIDDIESWHKRLESGDAAAAEELVELFYDRLVNLARSRLAPMPPQLADDEGAVISALRSFFSGIGQGQFSQLADENDLWRLLATITARKAVRQLRRHWKASGESGKVDRNAEITTLITSQLGPDREVELIEQYQYFLDSIDDPQLHKLAQLRLQGLDNSEIAGRLKIHQRSVQRKLKLIEAIWLELDREADARNDSAAH